MVAERAQQHPTTPSLQPTQTAPKTFTLAGRELACYRAGEHMGSAQSLSASARDTRRLKDHFRLELTKLQTALRASVTGDGDIPVDAIEAMPVLAEGLESIAANLDATASQHQQQGSRLMGQVAAENVTQEARWNPPWRAWGMLALAMSVATMVSTAAALYAIRAGW